MSTTAHDNPLRRLTALGQSVWLDYIERALLFDGTLSRLIRDDGLSGMTSNPAIFEKAIAGDPAYQEEVTRLAADGMTPVEIYESLTFEDVCCAANLLWPVYEQTEGRDGYVSIEVPPQLADDTDATIAEGVRVWDQINRANLMIKVPATPAGVAALRRLIGLGINVNATLLFSIERYREIAAAYMAGAEDYITSGQPPRRLASVASFFLSRIDSLIDPQLERLGTDAARLRGQAAIASARLAHAAYRDMMAAPRWQRLAGNGVRPQRLLWASTSTKDPAYSDVKYVEALIAPDTINTLPPETLAAYRDHGHPAIRIEEGLAEARQLGARLAALGIDLAAVAQDLERQGLRKFVEPYDRTLRALAGAPDRH